MIVPGGLYNLLMNTQSIFDVVFHAFENQLKTSQTESAHLSSTSYSAIVPYLPNVSPRFIL